MLCIVPLGGETPKWYTQVRNSLQSYPHLQKIMMIRVSHYGSQDKQLYEAERERAELEKQALQQQLQNMDVGFIVFIKSRIKKFYIIIRKPFR